MIHVSTVVQSSLEYTVSAKSTCKTNVVVYMIHVPAENRVSLNTVSAKNMEKIIVVVVYMINGPTVEAAG